MTIVSDECTCERCRNELPHVEAPALVPAPPRNRTIIGFTAQAGSGKSAAANHLIAWRAFTRGKFAGALKEMLRTFLRYRGASPDTIERMIEGDLKEKPSPLLNGKSPRHAMQTLGTEWGRNCIDVNLWVDTEMDAKRDVSKLVFDDIRYPNEAAAIEAAGGVVVRIVRPGAGAAGDAAGHTSEQTDQLPAAIQLVNGGALDDFLSSVEALARNITWAVAARSDATPER